MFESGMKKEFRFFLSPKRNNKLKTDMETPKEKAIQLVDKFEEHSFMDIDSRISAFDSVKKCALIAVEEIIITFIEIDPNIRYWQEVKNELNKL